MEFEPTQETLLSALRRYVKALDAWDIERWNMPSTAKRAAASELADCEVLLRALAGKKPGA